MTHSNSENIESSSVKHETTEHSAHVSHHNVGPWEIIVGSGLLNFVVLAIAIVYLGNKYLPGFVDSRKKRISKELENAKNARIKAEEELISIQKKCENIDSEIENIRNEAKLSAKLMKDQIEADTEQELLRLRQRFEREVSTAQEKAIQAIKEMASKSAIELAENAIVKITDSEEIQDRIIEEFIKEVEKPSNN